jgi:phosphatidylglycerol:prolipoprotein diacylglycerol transferase
VLPILLHFGRFSLPTYGFLAAVGLLAGLAISVRHAARRGMDPDKTWNLGILAILAGIVGAKLLLVVNDRAFYWAHPREILTLATLQAGGVWSGGLVAAVLVSWWYIRRNHIPLLKTCDVFAPGIALGHAIGRLGCFAAGCCWGKPTTLPWGVTFTNPLAGQLVGTPLGVRLHPTQLYEMALELGNFFLLSWALRRKQFDGQVIGAYMFVYGFVRYFLEFLRDDPERGSVLHGLMSGTQLLAIGLVIAGGLLWLRRNPRREIASPEEAPAKTNPVR